VPVTAAQPEAPLNGSSANPIDDSSSEHEE
jgi:hypothetical protein